jgi:hypothetical protein
MDSREARAAQRRKEWQAGAGTFAEAAAADSAFWQSMTAAERLDLTFSMGCEIYGYDPAQARLQRALGGIRDSRR